MMDASLVLRYFTIAEAYDSSNNGLFESYQGKVLSSMNKFMELKKKISQEEIEVFKKRFNDTVEKVYSVLERTLSESSMLLDRWKVQD